MCPRTRTERSSCCSNMRGGPLAARTRTRRQRVPWSRGAELTATAAQAAKRLREAHTVMEKCLDAVGRSENADEQTRKVLRRAGCERTSSSLPSCVGQKLDAVQHGPTSADLVVSLL